MSEYGQAWIVYLLAALALYAMLHYLSRNWRWSFPRTAWRGLLVVLLFTPAASVPGSGHLAPAHLVTVIALIQHDFPLAERALLHLLLALLAVIVVIAIKALVTKMGIGQGRSG